MAEEVTHLRWNALVDLMFAAEDKAAEIIKKRDRTYPTRLADLDLATDLLREASELAYSMWTIDPACERGPDNVD